jgi:hypothetical protein
MKSTRQIFQNVHNGINSIIIFLFLIHGGLYLFYPEAALDPKHPIKVIKYVVMGILLIVNIHTLNVSRILKTLSIVISGLVLVYYSNEYIQTDYSQILTKFLPYASPVFMILLVKPLSKINLLWMATLVFFIVCIAGIIEYQIGGIIRNFIMNEEDGGAVRIVSIFYNPNSSASVIAILNYCIQNKITLNSLLKQLYSLAIWALAIVLIIMTGSKTGLGLIAMHLLFLFHAHILKPLFRNKLKMIVVKYALFGITLLPFLLYAAQNYQSKLVTREVSSETVDIRFEQINTFFTVDIWKDFFAPFFYKKGEAIDNVYIQFWGDFSFVGFVFFIFITILSLYKLYYKSIPLFHIQLMLIFCGISYTFVYVFPAGYIYWYLVGYSLYTPNTFKHQSSSILLG